ncbi:NUDIX hydrolase [Streptomyces sp. bgisy027]|uniref:NUDIX hydrolase n=1 Tax=Streptomyces sp. bgisy027 TaxID=3413770 RepID=UPI003D720379
MTVTADHIRGTLDDYLDVRPHDTGQLVDLLELLDASADLTSRKEFRGHVTAGAILVDPAGRVLHVRHVALNRWLLPGGHLEANDISLLAAAQRELSEETGIPAAVVVPAGNRPVHIEAHLIPANPAKGEPDHQHFDFRFLFRTSADVVELQTEEVAAAAWRHVDTIENEALRSRVLEAMR